MTVIDLVIMLFAFSSLKMIIKYRRELQRLGSFLPMSFLILAVSLLGLFYSIDLFLMWGMPFFVDHSVAMGYMKNLHLNWSWGINLIVSICIFTGLVQIIRNLLVHAKGLGELNRSLDDELSRKDHEVTELNDLASHDALTELINRREFERRVNRLISTKQHDKSEHAMCFLDLDKFKLINDSCGHIAGDELLRQISGLLQNSIRKRDTLARLGGDEFAVLMEHCAFDHAHQVAEALLKTIKGYQFFWEGRTFGIGASIGLVAITANNNNFTELLKQADEACYLAKRQGRNRIQVAYAHNVAGMRKGSID
jgi:diguanylate cyclase (GGDEF)-like protein